VVNAPDFPTIFASTFKSLSSLKFIHRVPQGARLCVAECYAKILESLCLNNTPLNWLILLAFPFCLRLPNRKGPSPNGRSLTSIIKEQIIEYESLILTQMQFHLPLPGNYTQTKSKSTPPKSDYISRTISRKVGEGDIRGAARLASSNLGFAPVNDITFSALVDKHPTPPSGDTENLPPPVNQSTECLILSEPAIKASVISFPNGSSAGQDGLRPQILKDLISSFTGAAGDKIIKYLTVTANMMLRGEVPNCVLPYLYSARLCALEKPGGGIRPIAVGSTIRRLVAKASCKAISKTCGSSLAPLQLGIGTPLGAEAASHSMRRFLQEGEDVEVILKIDYKNAFNSIFRGKMLQAVYESAPSLYNLALQSYQSTSHLFYSGQIIPSSLGVQQGDPLGPLFFCLTINHLVRKLKSRVNVWYMDDGTFGGCALTAAKDLKIILEESPSIGLSVNSDKCELILGKSLTLDRKDFLIKTFTTLAPGIRVVQHNQASLLGSPLGEIALDSILEEKICEISRLIDRLSSLPAHVALFLLRHCFAIPKLTYTLRCSPCFMSDRLLEFDNLIKRGLENILNINLDERAWNQATLPISFSGIGLRSSSDLSSSAFLSSSHACGTLITSILPQEFVDKQDPMIREAILKRKVVGSPENPSSQRDWDRLLCNEKFDSLFTSYNDDKSRARLLASKSPRSGCWLHALPAPTLGLFLDDTQIRIGVALRLGSPICVPHSCNGCGAQVDESGTHGLSCPKSRGRFSRHAEINGLIQRSLASAGVPSVLEPPGVVRSDGKRPDGLTLCPWKTGRSLLWDFTCRDTLAPSYLRRTAQTAGAAATCGELEKRRKYSCTSDTYHFTPVCAETLGCWGPEAIKFLNEVGRRITDKSKEARATTFLYQRISMAIVRGNSASVIGTLPSQKFLDELLFL
jgi:hypothetical protein